MSERQILQNKFSVDEFGNIQMSGKVIIPVDYAVITPKPVEVDTAKDTAADKTAPVESVKPVVPTGHVDNKTKRRRKHKQTKADQSTSSSKVK